MINYGIIWNNNDITINLYHQTGIDLNATNHTLTSNLNKCGDMVTSLLFIIFILLKRLVDVLFALLCSNSSIFIRSSHQLQQFIELIMIYAMFTFTSLIKKNTSERVTLQCNCYTIAIFCVYFDNIYSEGMHFGWIICLLWQKTDLLCHKSKQLSEIIRLHTICDDYIRKYRT